MFTGGKIIAHTAIWQGFDYAWRSDPHRLNIFGSFVENNLDTAVIAESIADQAVLAQSKSVVGPGNGASEPIQGRYFSRLRHGDFGDTGDDYTYVHGIQHEGFQFVHGHVTAALAGNGCTAAGQLRFTYSENRGVGRGREWTSRPVCA